MKWQKVANHLGRELGKKIGSMGQKEREENYKKMMIHQADIDNNLWIECKNRIKDFNDDKFRILADVCQEICTGDRRYPDDDKHEVYSRLKHDMISYQYEKFLQFIDEEL